MNREPDHGVTESRVATTQRDVIVDFESAPGEGGGGEGLFSPRSLIAALRRRWLLCLAIGLPLGVASGLAAWQLVPAPFVATAEILIKARLDKILPGSRDDRGQFKTYKQTQIRHLTSDFVINTALRDLHARPTIREREFPREWLQRELQIGVRGTEFITASLAGENPDDLAAIVNAVTKAYIEEVVEKEKRLRQNRIVDLQKVRGDLEAQIDRQTDLLRQLAANAKAATIQQAENRQQALLEIAVAIRKEHAQLNIELIRQRVALEAREMLAEGASSARPEIPGRYLESLLASEPRYTAALTELEAAKIAYERQESITVKGHRGAAGRLLVEKERAVENAEAEVARVREETLPLLEMQLEQSQESAEQLTAVELRRTIRELEAQVAVLAEEMKKYESRADSTPTETFELAQQSKKLEETESLFSKVSAEISRLKIEAQAPVGVEVFQEAQPPRTRDFSKRNKLAGMGGLAVLGLVTGCVALIDVMSRKVSSSTDLSEAVPLPVIGNIPLLPQAIRSKRRSKRSPAKAAFWRNALTESVDSARTMLIQQMRQRDARSLVIASAVSGEGKTTVASHLAASLARSGRKIVLVDGDVRRSMLHSVFGVAESPGVSEWIRGEATVDEILHPTDPPTLSIIPAGHTTRDVIEAMARDALGPLVGELLERFDYVLFDSAPLLPVTDGLLIAQHTGGVVMVACRDRTRAAKYAQACRSVSMLGVPILGAISIGLEGPSSGYAYRYIYGSGQGLRGPGGSDSYVTSPRRSTWSVPG